MAEEVPCKFGSNRWGLPTLEETGKEEVSAAEIYEAAVAVT
jgi:hypothetical protein